MVIGKRLIYLRIHLPKKNKYTDWTKEELIKRVTALEKRKKYGLVWDEEKTKEKFEADAEGKFPVLKEVKSKEIITDKTQITHILIEGDNYHTLSVLNYTHEKKIDVIYIDPPYNTGNKTWKYNNDYVEKDDAYKHSKWLSFMHKRLKIAHRLLANDGFLICAIDDNEIYNVGLLLDEIFGEKNRLGLVTVLHNPKGRNQAKFFSANSEFMLVYARNIDKANFNSVALNEEVQSTFDQIDKDGKYRLEPFMRARTVWSRQRRPKNWYPIYVSKDLNHLTSNKIAGYHEVFPITNNGKEMAWKNVKETFDQLNSGDYFVARNETDKIRIYHKYREQQVLKNVWLDQKYQSEFHGTNLLKKILGKNIFEYPKSLYLLIDILKLTCKKDSIVLDYFAGSGTTGHAILELNKEDDGKRLFILSTNNENNIAEEVCYPRIKNVIKGYKNENKEFEKGLGGNLKYFKTSFVPQEPTDKNKELLTKEATEMLCLREHAFEFVSEKNGYKIYKNDKKYVGIIMDQEEIENFKKEVSKYSKPVSVYVFSLTDEDFSDEFSDMKKKVKVCSIPEAILRVYRRIFK